MDHICIYKLTDANQINGTLRFEFWGVRNWATGQQALQASCDGKLLVIPEPKEKVDPGSPNSNHWRNGLTHKAAERSKGHVTRWSPVTDCSIHPGVQYTPPPQNPIGPQPYGSYATRYWFGINVQPTLPEWLPKTI